MEHLGIRIGTESGPGKEIRRGDMPWLVGVNKRELEEPRLWHLLHTEDRVVDMRVVDILRLPRESAIFVAFPVECGLRQAVRSICEVESDPAERTRVPIVAEKQWVGKKGVLQSS